MWKINGSHLILSAVNYNCSNYTDVGKCWKFDENSMINSNIILRWHCVVIVAERKIKEEKEKDFFIVLVGSVENWS